MADNAGKKTCIYLRFKAFPHSILILSRRRTKSLHLMPLNKKRFSLAHWKQEKTSTCMPHGPMLYAIMTLFFSLKYLSITELHYQGINQIANKLRDTVSKNQTMSKNCGKARNLRIRSTLGFKLIMLRYETL